MGAFSQTMIVNPTVIIERPEASKQEEDSGDNLPDEICRPVHLECKIVVQLPFLTPLFSLVVRLWCGSVLGVRLMRLVNGRNLVEEINVNETLKVVDS